MGDLGAAAAAGEEAGPAGDVAEAAADRRDPVAGPGRSAVAGRAGTVRALAVGVRAVPPLAARWHLAHDGHGAAGQGGCGRAGPLGCLGGFHGGPGAPARGRAAEKGDLQAEPPGGVTANPMITGWAHPAAG